MNHMMKMKRVNLKKKMIKFKIKMVNNKYKVVCYKNHKNKNLNIK